MATGPLRAAKVNTREIEKNRTSATGPQYPAGPRKLAHTVHKFCLNLLVPRPQIHYMCDLPEISTVCCSHIVSCSNLGTVVE